MRPMSGNAATINRPSGIACSSRVKFVQRENARMCHGKCSVMQIADKPLVVVLRGRAPPFIGGKVDTG